MTNFIKLDSKLFSSDMYRKLNSVQRDIMIQLILMASKEVRCEHDSECKHGQFITSLESIRKECAKGTSQQNVRTALAKLEKCKFLTSKPTKAGRLISICYLVNNHKTEKRSNKVVNKPKESVPFYITKKKRKLSGQKLEDFERFWKAFNLKKDKAGAADSWLDIYGYSPDLVDIIIKSAESEAKARPSLVKKGYTPKWPQGWLTAKRWEDEVEEENTQKIGGYSF